MADLTVEGLLSTFSPDNTTFKLASTLMAAVPGVPEVVFYSSLEEARLLVAPELDDAGFERARARLSSPEVLAAIKIADTIDTGDVGISVFTGIRTALNFFFGNTQRGLDANTQQGTDAALKAAGLAWMVHRLYSGPVATKIGTFRATPAGEVLLTWYAAVEICLPFADDLATGAGPLMKRLADKYGSGTIARFGSMLGGSDGEGATGMLTAMAEPLEQVVQSVGAHTQTIAESARTYLPSSMVSASTIASAVATAADALPVYRLLGARLAIEAALKQEALAMAPVVPAPITPAPITPAHAIPSTAPKV